MHTAIEDLWSKRTQYQDFSKQQCLLAWCAQLDAEDEKKKGEVQEESQHPPEAGGKVSGLIEGGAAAAAFPGTELQEKHMDEDVDDALGMDGNRLGAQSPLSTSLERRERYRHQAELQNRGRMSQMRLCEWIFL